jgi:lipopolysaccharide export system protein LptC
MGAESADAALDAGSPAPAPTPPGPAARRPLRTAHTRFVAMMKWVLPVTAAGLVAIMVVWSQDRDQDRAFTLGQSTVRVEDVAGQRVVNARYTGTDNHDRPYTITAEALAQASRDTDVIQLNGPKADVALGDASWAALTAPTGTYSRKERLLHLAGGVNLFHDRGYEFHTERAVIDLGLSSARGDDPVDGQGPFGTLQSDGFRIEDGGQRILFTGRAKLVIYSSAPDPRRAGGARR